MINSPIFTKLAVDTTVVTGGAPVWNTLKTISITISDLASNLLVIATASGEFSGGGAAGDINVYLRVLLDGVVVQGAASGVPLAANTNWSAATTKTYAPTAGGQPRVGVHTLTLQWASDVGTAKILGATAPTSEHAAFYVEEVPGTGPGAPVFQDLAADLTTVSGTFTTLVGTPSPGLAITTTNVGLTEKKAVYKNLNTDATATGAFALLLSASVTILAATGQLFILASVAIEQTIADGVPIIDIFVDGSSIGQGTAAWCAHISGATEGNFRYLTTVACPTLAIGVHTIEIWWKTTAGTTTCNASSDPTLQSARILAQEKPV